MIQELHEERMDKKPQPTDEGRFIKAYLPEEEMIGPFLLTGQANPNSFRELESILKSTQRINVQPTHLLEGIKSPNLTRGRDGSISLYWVTAK